MLENFYESLVAGDAAETLGCPVDHPLHLVSKDVAEIAQVARIGARGVSFRVRPRRLQRNE